MSIGARRRGLRGSTLVWWHRAFVHLPWANSRAAWVRALPGGKTMSGTTAAAGILSRERIIAGPKFNRWMVPPAALAIHLSIGMAYGFSVFWLPLSRAIGVTAPAPGDWKISTLGWMYTLFFVMLGSSAALFCPWVERAGPRKAGAVAACCWGGGFFISALGIYTHQIALLWLGSGVLGGCG